MSNPVHSCAAPTMLGATSIELEEFYRIPFVFFRLTSALELKDFA